MAAVYATLDLNRPEADLLATLWRAQGTPLAPSRLASQLMCSTGTMTNRLDRLERAGLLRRQDDPDDRRGVLVALTDQGAEVIKAAVAAREALETPLIPGLSSEEHRTHVGLLRKVLVATETSSENI